MPGLAFCDDWAEKFAAVNHPRNRSHRSDITNERLLRINARCVNRFMEVTLDELESAELAVEDGVGIALLDLFEAVAIDEASISFTLSSQMEQQLCSIRIDAWCFFDAFPILPENIEFAVEDRISPILAELFGEVIVDDVTLS